jgi:DtxR family Mn-dependent transcriptional regulator
VTDLLADMEKKNLVRFQNGLLRLTTEGQRYALHVIRAHRLWERYLAEETGFEEGEWHRRAERLEHDLSPTAADNLYLQLNRPSHDPHGDPIPTADGRLEAEPGKSLAALAPDTVGRILHLEDEPPSVYVQLIAQGLRPGLVVRVLEKSAERVRFWAGGDEHVLATLLANNVNVAPLPQMEISSVPSGQSLAQLRVGGQGRVVGLTPACRGADRRRLLDLGFVPGALVTAEMISPSGDPTAYRIRGTLIALRREQANEVHITPAEKALAI